MSSRVVTIPEDFLNHLVVNIPGFGLESHKHQFELARMAWIGVNKTNQHSHYEDAMTFTHQDLERWPRLFEQCSPTFKWTPGGLPKVQSYPRRRASLATSAEPRWVTRGAPRISFYAASTSLGSNS